MASDVGGLVPADVDDDGHPLLLEEWDVWDALDPLVLPPRTCMPMCGFELMGDDDADADIDRMRLTRTRGR